TSDHEVNLKILFNPAMRRGELSQEQRDRLLIAVKNDVAGLVLQDNYDQTFAISVAETTAAGDLDASARFIRDLERSGKLDRAVEHLPDEETLRTLAREGRGLTRPDVAV